MKRFLLTMICAMAMVAVNAHTVKKVDLSQLKNVKVVKGQAMKQKAAALNISNASIQAAKFIKNMPAKAKRNVAPTGMDKFEGNWVEEHTEWADELTSSNVASQAELTIEEDEMGEYIMLEGIAEGYAELYAEYDPETGLLHIPSLQYCYEHETYGQFAFCALTEEGNISQDDYTLQVEEDENGHITMYSTSENGWVILITEGEYAMQPWNFGDDLILNKANFEFTGSERHVENSAWTKFAYVEGEYVYVDNIEGTVIVHGMWGTSIMLSMAEDGINFTIPNGQPTSIGWISNDEFFTYTNYNCGEDEEGYITVPMTNDGTCAADPEFELPGFISATGAYVFAAPEFDEEGNPYWDYFYVAHFITEEGRGYFRNLWAGIALLPLEEEGNGISSVNNTVKANNITFNVAGQKVSKDYKGLVIRNGQKFMNK